MLYFVSLTVFITIETKSLNSLLAAFELQNRMLTGLTSWLNGSTSGNGDSSSSSSSTRRGKRNNDSSSSAPSSSRTAKKSKTGVSWERDANFPLSVENGREVNYFLSSDKERTTVVFPKSWTKPQVVKWGIKFFPEGNRYSIRVEALHRTKGQCPKARLTKIHNSSDAV